MQLQVENTACCCAAVSRGEVDVAVVGGQIPADLEHLLQVPPCKLLYLTRQCMTLLNAFAKACSAIKRQ